MPTSSHVHIDRPTFRQRIRRRWPHVAVARPNQTHSAVPVRPSAAALTSLLAQPSSLAQFLLVPSSLLVQLPAPTSSLAHFLTCSHRPTHFPSANPPSVATRNSRTPESDTLRRRPPVRRGPHASLLSSSLVQFLIFQLLSFSGTHFLTCSHRLTHFPSANPPSVATRSAARRPNQTHSRRAGTPVRRGPHVLTCSVLHLFSFLTCSVPQFFSFSVSQVSSLSSHRLTHFPSADPPSGATRNSRTPESDTLRRAGTPVRRGPHVLTCSVLHLPSSSFFSVSASQVPTFLTCSHPLAHFPSANPPSVATRSSRTLKVKPQSAVLPSCSAQLRCEMRPTAHRERSAASHEKQGLAPSPIPHFRL